MAYDRPPEKKEDEEKKSKAELRVVTEMEKAGMTEVIKDFYEHKNGEEPAQTPGLSTRYQADTSPTKGLLLNKKA